MPSLETESLRSNDASRSTRGTKTGCVTAQETHFFHLALYRSHGVYKAWTARFPIINMAPGLVVQSRLSVA